MEAIILILSILVIFFFFCNRSNKKKYRNTNKKLTELRADFESYDIASIDVAQDRLNDINKKVVSAESRYKSLQNVINADSEKEEELRKKNEDAEHKLLLQKNKIVKCKDLYNAIQSTITRFYESQYINYHFPILSKEDNEFLDSFAPSVILSLNSMNYQDLRKKFLNNQKQINELLDSVKTNYTTKTNQAIYQLMVMALSAELQNILTKLKYGKLDEGLQDVNTVITKYIIIAEAGNQQLVGSIKKFIYTLQSLYEDAVKIEYEYYIKREQARQEQIALKARMKEEREEQRRLKEQEQHMLKEQEKYLNEKERLETNLNEATSEEDKAIIMEAIAQIDTQLSEIDTKKEEIVKLQHGKAGNVYIISNIGSFGENVFKIGMTRRLDPQERIDELGSASVPFGFDVHSFIFSEDASELETELHRRLNDSRVNKVNRRKEFFNVTLDELEELVNEIYPSAEFKRTILAEEYRQSLSLTRNAFDFDAEDNNDNEEEEDIEAV